MFLDKQIKIIFKMVSGKSFGLVVLNQEDWILISILIFIIYMILEKLFNIVKLVF